TPTRFAMSIRRSIALFISSPLNVVKIFHYFLFPFNKFMMNLKQRFKNINCDDFHKIKNKNNIIN
ncbi:hypothetical protein DLB95_28625, partial [Salmonella enterica subsp. diarizonae]|nr:hypothetical protein [Salmonella enterica subsp. diarizonae]ECJ4381045.1 hypothetical protein [Salmonella enterica subsp. diarizonae]